MKYEINSEKFEVTLTSANGQELIHACGSVHLRADLAALVASVVAMLTEEPKPEEPKPEGPKPEEPKPEEPKPEERSISLQELVERYQTAALSGEPSECSPVSTRVGEALVFHNGPLPPHVIDDILRTMGIGDAKQE